jgi:hypothetical protein
MRNCWSTDIMNWAKASSGASVANGLLDRYPCFAPVEPRSAKRCHAQLAHAGAAVLLRLHRRSERLLIGLASRLAFFKLTTGAITPICRIEDDLPTTRLNDGRCDRQGRFVFGTLNEDAGAHPSPASIASMPT